MKDIQDERAAQQLLAEIRTIKATLRGKGVGDYAYFLVAAHGVGQLSILFYLYLLGLPCAGYNGKPGVFLPWAKGRAWGFLVERIFGDRPPQCMAPLPAVWVVRDPIAILATSINFIFTHGLFSLLGGFWSPASLNVSLAHLSHKEALGERISGAQAGSTLMQGSQLRQLARAKRVRVLDTQDLSAARVEDTLRGLCDFLGQPYAAEHSELFTRSYNAAHARLDLCYTALEIAGQRCFVWDRSRLEYMTFYFKYSFGMDVCPLYEFAYEDSSLCVCHLLDGEVRPVRQSVIARKDDILRCYRLRTQMVAHFDQILQAEKTTGERVLEMLRQDAALRSDFLRMQEKEVAILEQHAPGHSARWELFKQL